MRSGEIGGCGATSDLACCVPEKVEDRQRGAVISFGSYLVMSSLYRELHVPFTMKAQPAARCPALQPTFPHGRPCSGHQSAAAVYGVIL